MKMKLSKSQWEFIGRKTGWMQKQAGTKDKIISWLNKITKNNVDKKEFDKAYNFYEQYLRGQIKIEEMIRQLNITPEDLKKAEQIVNLGKDASIQSSLIKKSRILNFLDARIIICILIAFLSAGMYKSLKNSVENMAAHQEARYQDIK